MALVGSLSGSLGLVAVTGSFEPGVDNVYSIGTASKKWNTVVSTALSGSLTKLADGTSYIIAGSSIAVSTGSNGAITISTVGVGTGDVTGPGSSTDNAVARFDLTTGKIIQNSAVTISDESSNIVSIAGSATATTVNLFNTDATTVNIAGAASTATNIGNASGLTTIAGDLKVAGNDIQSSTGATAITLSGGNVIIPGDLTVQGTTVTVDATTLTIEDPVIGLGFTSGSTATTAGDRGFIGGISGSDNVALIWDNTDSTFTSARTSTGAGNDPVAITSYTPFRASSFQVGGTPGSAVAAGSAYLSSSDALNVLVNHTSTTTFTKAGTPTIQISDYAGSGEGQIKGVTTANALSALWISGSAVNVGSPSVAFLVNDVQQATIKPLAAGAGVRFEGQDGTGAPRAMVISGSQTTIGSNNRLVVFEGAGVPFLTASVGGGIVSLTAGAAVGTASVFNTVSTTVNLAQAATTINMGNVAGTNNVAGVTKFTQGLSGSLTRLTDGTSYLIAGTNISVTTGSNGAVTISTSGGGDVTGPGSSTDTAIARFNGLTGKIIQNTAGVTIDAVNNVVTSGSFQTKDGGGNLVARINNNGEITGSNALFSGDLAVNGGDITTIAATFNLIDATATTVNFARAATSLVAGASGGSTTFQGNLTGSNFLANGSLTVVQGASIGGGFGSTGTTITGDGNISTNGTLLVQGATTLSGSVILGDATGDDLTFNGYAASHLVPKTTNLFDLGTPDLRWRNMYTGDLHLKNERGDWTVIEEEDFLTLTNNKSGKRYKFVLEEI